MHTHEKVIIYGGGIVALALCGYGIYYLVPKKDANGNVIQMTLAQKILGYSLFLPLVLWLGYLLWKNLDPVQQQRDQNAEKVSKYVQDLYKQSQKKVGL
jgi:hypothetical protein